MAPEYRGVLADRYPSPGVWRQVDDAARHAEELWSSGREIDFQVDAGGSLKIALVESDGGSRDLSVLEALAVAAGAPV